MEQENCKGRYSHTEKIKTLRILESNDFNYLKTSRQTKISRPTLRKWEKIYGTEVFSGKSPTEEALAEIDVELKNNDINIIRSLYTLRKRSLQRVMALAEKETRLESLLRVLQFASGELQKFSVLEKEEPDSTEDFLAMIENLRIKSEADQKIIYDQEGYN